MEGLFKSLYISETVRKLAKILWGTVVMENTDGTFYVNGMNWYTILDGASPIIEEVLHKMVYAMTQQPEIYLLDREGYIISQLKWDEVVDQYAESI